jgi:hypothetical protein
MALPIGWEPSLNAGPEAGDEFKQVTFGITPFQSFWASLLLLDI